MTISLPVNSQNASYKVEVKEGQKYVWCSCGLSNKQPFCDGQHKQHKNPNGTPIMRPVIYEAKKDGIVGFCGCRQSKKGAICDGSHKHL
ncbi:MAG: CDGSH iron-sulfur domain-containing protein [Rickettsiales bacterium]|nr:CDGSH iron-sulfur domain-containing protein [Rickettsiales bacterium]